MHGRARLLPLLVLIPLLAACGGEPAAAPRIPAKTVVLTFDDGFRNHLDFVVPELEKRGFGATFFVTGVWAGTRDHLSFPEYAEFSKRGFEVGSHSFEHAGFHTPEGAKLFPADLKRLEGALADVGVPRPVSFAWPGGVFGPEARQILIDRGYLFGRRVIHPEFPPGVVTDGIVYDPEKHDPLLIPTYGLVCDAWSLDHFAGVVAKATEGKAVVLCFHGVPDSTNRSLSTSPERFLGMMDLLSENGYRCVAMRDLAKWVDPAARPPDPLVGRRVPE